MSQADIPPSHVIVGSSSNFWIWSHDAGWDLTHPSTPTAPPIQRRLKLDCHISNVSLDPAKTALLIIDMQNFSMSSALGESIPAALQAQEALLQYAIPAARTAKIQIIWLNWGLSESDLETLTPAAFRVFGWMASCKAEDYGIFDYPLGTDRSEERGQNGEFRQVGFQASN